MLQKPSLQWLGGLALMCAAIAAVAGAVPAQQTGAVRLSAHVGLGELGPRYDWDSWAPVRVAVANDGPMVAGTLVVKARTFRGTESRYERRVELPTGSRRVVELVIHHSGGDAPTVELEVDGDVIASEKVGVASGAGYGDMRVLVVDTQTTALNDITSVQVDLSSTRRAFSVPPKPQQQPATPGGNPSAIVGSPPPPPGSYGGSTVALKPSVVGPNDLPRSSYGYSVADAVVLNDAPLSTLEPEQVDALRLWVAAGGLLVVTGGADFAGARASALGDLLPVEVAERRTLSDLPELAAIYGSFSTSGADPTAAVVALGTLAPRATVLLADATAPLVAERAYGGGTVRFVALDPKLAPIRGWQGAATLWSDVLRPAGDRLARQSRSMPVTMQMGPQDGLGALLRDLGGISGPNIAYYFVFLMVYLIALGPVNYLVLRSRRRLELSWLTIPALVLVFTAGTIAVARLARGFGSISVGASLERHYGDEGVSHSTGMTMFVPDGNGEYELELPEHGLANDSSFFDVTPAGTLALDLTETAPVLRADLNTWEARVFATTSTANAEPPLKVRVAPGSVSVLNTTGDPYASAVLLTSEGVYVVGDVPPGAERSAPTAELPATSFLPWYASKLPGGSPARQFVDSLVSSPPVLEEMLSGALPRAAYGSSVLVLDRATLGQLSRPVLVAVRDAERPSIKVASGARGRSLAFVVQHVGGAR